MDLAAMRDAMQAPAVTRTRSTRSCPAAWSSTTPSSRRVQLGVALTVNAEKEFARNRERYEFLKWGSRPSTTSVWCPGSRHRPSGQSRVSGEDGLGA